MWNGDRFYYSVKILKAIAGSYSILYDGLSFRETSEIVNPISLAEYKADFDTALRGIGRGKWEGDIKGDFGDYKGFGKLQRVIIANILGIPDKGLTGFYDIPKLRSIGYHLMKAYLNGEECQR